MTASPVAAEIHVPFNVHRYLAAAITLNDIVAFYDLPDAGNIVRTKIIAVHLVGQISFIKYLTG
jgi:hypothetical protein